MTDSTINDDQPPGAADPVISEEEFLAESPRLRLRLHHFFAFTAVVSVLLALSRPPVEFGNPQAQFSPGFQKFQIVAGALYQIPAAIVLTALGYGIAARRRGELWFNQPGHWLIVEIALIELFGIPVSLVFRWLQFSSPTAPSPTAPNNMGMWLLIFFGLYSFVVLFVGRILVNVYLGVRKCRPSRWKSVFYAKIVSVVVVGLGDIAVLVILIAATRADRRERLLRNPGHWCGVYVQLAQSALALLFMIGSVFAFVL